jgi:uncharacterized membrane protein YjjP (DUF1212 family)
VSGDGRELHALILRLGIAMNFAGDAVSAVQERLQRIAAAYGLADARIVVLPSTLLVSMDAAGVARLESRPPSQPALRLDQTAALYELVDQAERGALDPEDGLRRLDGVLDMPPRFPPAATVAGYALLSVGLSLVLGATPFDLALSAGLGALVGTLKLAFRHSAPLQQLAPVVVAMIVSTLALLVIGRLTPNTTMSSLIAPLVTFLPGALLTTATLDLASGETISGASRLVAGFLQLGLLAFGITGGGALAGAALPAALAGSPAVLPGWSAWCGLVLYGLGVFLHLSAPRRTLPWLMLVLLSAWIGQLIGAAVLGRPLSGFAGALVATPVAALVERSHAGPPSIVTFLPAFWLLVPGALGLVGVTRIVASDVGSAFELVGALESIVTIALGVLTAQLVLRWALEAWSRVHRR